MKSNTVVVAPLSPRVNIMLATELAARGIPEDVYLSRLKDQPMFELPEDVYEMLRKQSGIVAGRDYRVIRGASRRVRKPRLTIDQMVQKGIVARGLHRLKNPSHIVGA